MYGLIAVDMAELMILGFISLLLSVSTTYVVKICIPIKLGKTLLPCHHYNEKRGLYDDKGENEGGDRRKLLSYAEAMMLHRSLAARDEHEDYCAAKVGILLCCPCIYNFAVHWNIP